MADYDSDLEEFEELDDEILEEDSDDVSQAIDDSDSTEAADSHSAQEARRQAPGIVFTSLPITGEPRVDDALARLTDLSDLPVDEHVPVFEDVQRRLHDTLADLSGQ